MSTRPFASFGTINAMPRAEETHPLTWRLRDDGAMVALDEYRDKHGYEGARNALDMKSDDISELVKEAGLKGRGGAGFPAGVKWSLTAKGEEMPRGYVVCNADEMEPNTYKDRMLMEQMPHLLIEGMIISALANNAFRGYIFLRGEYHDAAASLERALAEAREAGILGANVLGSEFDFDIFLHTGAGRYICGEETALINSLEGRRANPRSKPPFPGQSGAWGKPTVVNNVETLCNAPPILYHGKEWYLGLALEGSDDGGTKLFGFTGQLKNPGLWELPLGTPAREIFEDYAQGMKDGYRLKAWQPGGAGTGFLLPEHLSAQMCSNGIEEVGTRMGTGLSLAVDHTVSMVSLLRNMEEFFARESCGWCTPCRDGLPWTVKILSSLERGEGEQGDIEILEELTGKLGPGKTFCAHAPGAVEPLASAIQYFRDEFEQGISHPRRAAHAEPIPVGSI